MGNEAYINMLVGTDPLRESILRKIIQTLGLPPSSHGLDAGCGIGTQAIYLAQAIMPDGQVTGLDLSADRLGYTEGIIRQSAFAKQITFKQGDVISLPFPDKNFDWVWSCDCIGYPAGDLPPILKELLRVTKPGGKIAVLAYSSQQLLPGYHLLEARLNASCSSYVPILNNAQPNAHFTRALGHFQKAGLQDVSARTFVKDIQAPLSLQIRQAVVLLFEMLWGDVQNNLSDEDWRTYQRLCQADSPECILDIPDYYGFFTYSLFTGILPS